MEVLAGDSSQMTAGAPHCTQDTYTQHRVQQEPCQDARQQTRARELRLRPGLLHTPHDAQKDATTATTNTNLRQSLAWALCLPCVGLPCECCSPISPA